MDGQYPWSVGVLLVGRAPLSLCEVELLEGSDIGEDGGSKSLIMVVSGKVERIVLTLDYSHLPFISTGHDIPSTRCLSRSSKDYWRERRCNVTFSATARNFPRTPFNTLCVIYLIDSANRSRSMLRPST